MRADEFDGEYQSLQDDKYNQASIEKRRNPRFTLKHLNRLKKMRSAQALERAMRMDTLEVIYGAPDDQAAGGLGL